MKANVYQQAAAAALVLGTLALAPEAQAGSVLFDGQAFNSAPGGGSATFVHVDNPAGSGGGSLLWELDSGGSTGLTYQWNEPTASFDDAFAVFGSAGGAPVVSLDLKDHGAGFDAVLRLGTSGVAADNRLDVGTDGAAADKAVNGTPLGNVTLTHTLGGKLSYQLLDKASNFLLASGILNFQEADLMGPFNKVGQVPAPGPVDSVVGFLWGAGAAADVTSDCQGNGNCQAFVSKVGSHGLGLDLAFTGAVPEPGTLGLLAIGLIGAGIRRRAEGKRPLGG